MSALTTLTAWTGRQWASGAVAGVGVALAVGLPTDVIPNPVFGRPVPVTWWSYPVLGLTAVMGGMLIATYVRTAPWIQSDPGAQQPNAESADELDAEAERQAKTGGVAGMLSFFAVGCPVCNKIVLLALGTAGARQWFEPFQPVLAGLSLLLLGYALVARLASDRACPIGGSLASSSDHETHRRARETPV